MARGLPALAILAVAAVTLALAAAGDGERAGRLTWASPPRLVAPPALPGDAVLYGEVRNDGVRRAAFAAADVRVLDARGRPLPSAARFLPAYARGAAGRAVTLAPGRTAPLTVAWRGAGARRVALGVATLAIPR
jgi:hypothetical protein